MNIFHSLPDKPMLTDTPVLQNSIIQNHKTINRSHKTLLKKKLAELEQNGIFLIQDIVCIVLSKFRDLPFRHLSTCLWFTLLKLRELPLKAVLFHYGTSRMFLDLIWVLVFYKYRCNLIYVRNPSQNQKKLEMPGCSRYVLQHIF